MGFYLMRRSVLDHAALPRWDACFRRSITNEIRFPTIAGLGGYRVGEIPLPHVRHDASFFTGEPGVFHSIKTVVEYPAWGSGTS
jgi:hypothetical protein